MEKDPRRIRAPATDWHRFGPTDSDGTSLVGLQASSRSGLVSVELDLLPTHPLDGERVTIAGRAITVFDGTLSPAANPTKETRLQAGRYALSPGESSDA